MISLEFYLPGFDTVRLARDVVDCPTTVSQDEQSSMETDGPTDPPSRNTRDQAGQAVGSSFHQGHVVTQPTDKSQPDDPFVFTWSDRDHTDAAAKKSFEEKIQSLPEHKRLVLDMLLDDIKSNKCKIELNERTGHVIVEYSISTVPPEYTFRLSTASSCLSPKEEVERFCEMIDHIKFNRYPSGVVFDRTEVRPGATKNYREGSEYSIANVVLGEGLYGKVKVTLDNRTKKSQAKKEIRINHICSDEIRAMTDLNDSEITPRLFLCQLDRDKVQLFMEILDDSVTIEDVIKQLAAFKYRKSDLGTLQNVYDIRQFALYIFIEMFKAMQRLHQSGWFHRDLHGGNVLLQSSGGEDVKVRILDLGNAAYVVMLRKHEDRTQLSRALADDIVQLLMHFSSLYIADSFFEDSYDFKCNYAERFGEIPNTHLGEEQKTFLISVIENGLMIKIVQQEEAFISGLESKQQNTPLNISANDSVRRIVSMLEFKQSSQSQFHDVHMARQPERVPGACAVPEVGSDVRMGPIVSQLRNVHLKPMGEFSAS